MFGHLMSFFTYAPNLWTHLIWYIMTSEVYHQLFLKSTISILLLLLMTIIVSLRFIFYILKMKCFQSSNFFICMFKPSSLPKLKSYIQTMGEYMSHMFQECLESNGIISQWSCSSTPQQNGIVERKSSSSWCGAYSFIGIINARTILVRSSLQCYSPY